MSVKLYYKCEAHIDQGRYIGDDPVGCKCSQDATYEWAHEGYSVAICNDCRKKIFSSPERISFHIDETETLNERQAKWKAVVRRTIDEEFKFQ